MWKRKPSPSDPPLLAAVRVKARLFVEFLEEEQTGAPSRAVIEDYNRLRGLALGVVPDLAGTMPPAIEMLAASTRSADEDESNPQVVTRAELLFFCRQVASFLK